MVRFDRRLYTTATGLALALLAGCIDPAPTGQVVAVVKGEDITLRDLAAEVAASGTTRSAAEVRGELTRQLVDRRLFVQAAQARRIDRSPEYLARLRRLREILLADMLVERMAREQEQPTPAQRAAFIAANPWAFAERRIIDVTAANDAQGAVRALDTATLDPRHAEALVAAPIGSPVTLDTPQGGETMIVRRRTPAPLTSEMAEKRANQALRRKHLDTIVQQFLTASRSEAEIRYQDGFGAPAS